MQPLLIIIKSTSICLNSLKGNELATIPIKEKKSSKAKLSNIIDIKK